MADFVYAGDAGAFKTCPDCGSFLLSSSFHKSRDRHFGFSPYCKECVKRRGKERYVKCRDKVIAINQRWIDANPEKVAARRVAWRAKNPGYDVEWRQRDIEKNRQMARERARRARELSPKARVSNAISCAIRDQISGKVKNGRKSFDLLGYTFADLKSHLERHFTPGMSWDNYGRGGWEIDHIIPVSAHNFNSHEDEDFKKCWALNNLRPMWAPENRSKQAKLLRDFQPSFAFS